MADPLLVQTLKQKRAEISGVIAAHQAKIAQALSDTPLRNSVVFKVVQSCGTLRDATLSLWSRSGKVSACGRRLMGSCFALPIAAPGPADRCPEDVPHPGE
jgi:hypothetical protein